MKSREKLVFILKTRKYFAVFLLLLAILAPILAVTSNILVPPTFEFNTIADPKKIALVGIITILMALNGTALRFRADSKNTGHNKAGFVGAIAGLFTSTCAVCQPIWLWWLGFGSASGFLADISVYVGSASIVLLSFSLYQLLNDESCEVKVHGKNN